MIILYDRPINGAGAKCQMNFMDLTFTEIILSDF